MKFHFLAFFRKIVKILFIKMTAFFLPVCSNYSISCIILFAVMKVHSYARKYGE